MVDGDWAGVRHYVQKHQMWSQAASKHSSARKLNICNTWNCYANGHTIVMIIGMVVENQRAMV